MAGFSVCESVFFQLLLFSGKANRLRSRHAFYTPPLCPMHKNLTNTMKFLTLILLFFSFFSSAQTENRKLVDSLKFIKEMPYICRDTVPTDLSVFCVDKIFWRTVKQKKDIIPFLIDKLADTTQTEANVQNFGGQYSVADIAYTALGEIIKDIPTFELLGVKFDENGCGYCSYWNHLRLDIQNRIKFQSLVRSWYYKNESNLVWVTSIHCVLLAPRQTRKYDKNYGL